MKLEFNVKKVAKKPHTWNLKLYEQRIPRIKWNKGLKEIKECLDPNANNESTTY